MVLTGTAVSLFTFPEGTNGNMVVPFHFPVSLAFNNRNLKDKFNLEQATKAQRGSRGITLLFL
jgi:hypothetical protein